MFAKNMNDIMQEISKEKQEPMPNWADEFCGIWNDDPRSAEEIIMDIRESRHRHDQPISLEYLEKTVKPSNYA